MIFIDFIIKFAIIQKIIKMKKIVFALTLVSLVIIGCKNKQKQQETKEVASTENIKESLFKISGMSCNIGCAKKIQSDLSKKEGVVRAKVVFADSTATVKYDATKIDKVGLATLIEGIADGKTYEVTKISDVKACKVANSSAKTKKPCSPNCTKQCGSKKKTAAKSDSEGCQKECCAKKTKKQCNPNCKQKCDKATANGNSKESQKECCAKKTKKQCSPNCKQKCDKTKTAA